MGTGLGPAYLFHPLWGEWTGRPAVRPASGSGISLPFRNNSNFTPLLVRIYSFSVSFKSTKMVRPFIGRLFRGKAVKELQIRAQSG